jgi:hypothetical protein
MTDEPVLISVVKLQVRKLKLSVLNKSDVVDEDIMISNLPLLFADGYPTCLEKFTLVSSYVGCSQCMLSLVSTFYM